MVGVDRFGLCVDAKRKAVRASVVGVLAFLIYGRFETFLRTGFYVTCLQVPGYVELWVMGCFRC